jgi:hypothetical protein
VPGCQHDGDRKVRQQQPREDAVGAFTLGMQHALGTSGGIELRRRLDIDSV